MSPDAMEFWLKKTQSTTAEPKAEGIQVIRRIEIQSRGNIIMEVAEKIRPFLTKMFDGVRDDEGMLLQPAHIRGIALNVAQGLVKNQEAKNN